MELPLNVVKLLVGYFSRTLNEAEHDALDAWICEADRNMEFFEECLEISLLPRNYDPARDDFSNPTFDALYLN